MLSFLFTTLSKQRRRLQKSWIGSGLVKCIHGRNGQTGAHVKADARPNCASWQVLWFARWMLINGWSCTRTWSYVSVHRAASTLMLQNSCRKLNMAPYPLNGLQHWAGLSPGAILRSDADQGRSTLLKVVIGWCACWHQPSFNLDSCQLHHQH